MANELRKWVGDPPKDCDLCGRAITTAFIDGKTYEGTTRGMPGGRWACMCLKCHASKGVGLGEGVGQQYEKTVDAVFGEENRAVSTPYWVKVAG